MDKSALATRISFTTPGMLLPTYHMTGEVVIMSSYLLVKVVPIFQREPQNMKYERLWMFTTMTPQQEMVLKLQGKEMATLTRIRGKILN